MNCDCYLRNYNLYFWIGIMFGLFVYVVLFMGCFVFFDYEVYIWEDLV